MKNTEVRIFSGSYFEDVNPNAYPADRMAVRWVLSECLTCGVGEEWPKSNGNGSKVKFINDPEMHVGPGEHIAVILNDVPETKLPETMEWLKNYNPEKARETF